MRSPGELRASGALWQTFAYPPLSGWDVPIEGQAAFRADVPKLAQPAAGQKKVRLAR